MNKLKKDLLHIIRTEQDPAKQSQAIEEIHQGAKEGRWTNRAYSFSGYHNGSHSVKSPECKLYEYILLYRDITTYTPQAQNIIRANVGKKFNYAKYNKIMSRNQQKI